MLEQDLRNAVAQAMQLYREGAFGPAALLAFMERVEGIADRVAALEREAVPPHLRATTHPAARGQHNVVSLLERRQAAARTVS